MEGPALAHYDPRALRTSALQGFTAATSPCATREPKTAFDATLVILSATSRLSTLVSAHTDAHQGAGGQDHVPCVKTSRCPGALVRAGAGEDPEVLEPTCRAIIHGHGHAVDAQGGRGSRSGRSPVYIL